MRLLDSRLQKPFYGTEFAYTEWEGVLHLTKDGDYTLCGWKVARSITGNTARLDNKSICPGCVPKQFNKSKR